MENRRLHDMYVANMALMLMTSAIMIRVSMDYLRATGQPIPQTPDDFIEMNGVLFTRYVADLYNKDYMLDAMTNLYASQMDALPSRKFLEGILDAVVYESELGMAAGPSNPNFPTTGEIIKRIQDRIDKNLGRTD